MEELDRIISENMIDPRVRTVVDHIVAEARPLRIVLFGSHAAGTARADSDIDLLVVMPDGIDRRAVMAEIGSRLPRQGVGIDLLVATPATLKEHSNNPGLIYRQILSKGLDVYVTSDHKSLRGDGA